MDKRVKKQVILTYSPGQAAVLKMSGLTYSGDEVTVSTEGGFVRICIEDTNNGVKRTSEHLLNSVTVASVLVVNEEKSLAIN